MQTIFERVRNIVAIQFGYDDDEILLRTTLQELGAESLDIDELVMELEEEFRIEIFDEEIQRIQTIEDIVEYLIDKVKQRECR